MGRVARALIWHELVERTRDRWVLLISVLFALLCSGVSLYGRTAESAASSLIGPSLVTLISLFVPLVALVLGHDAIVGERERHTLGLLLSLPIHKAEVVVAKFLGRALAMIIAVAVGLTAAMAMAGMQHRLVLLGLVLPTLLLGGAFLAIGVMLSAATSRQVTAASLVVVTWFLMVFFYDLGLLGLLVITDGAVSQGAIARLVAANPAGLYRMEMMVRFSGPSVFENLGMSASVPGAAVRGSIWAAWVVAPLVLSGVLLVRRKSS